VADRRRVAFLGIGHPLRRDDAAGVEVCERMRPRLRRRGDVLVVSGGSAPENCIGALRAFGPDLVVIIDAARMGQAPGTLLRIEPSDPRAAGASTHTLPLPAFCAYVETTLGCDVTLLGIEPLDTSFGEGLSPVVERAVAEAASQAAEEWLYGPALSDLEGPRAANGSLAISPACDDKERTQ
jgi:hydrogenase 3 maturation protease